MSSVRIILLMKCARRENKIGEITKERLDRLREADDILTQEIVNADVYKEIGQAFVVLLPVNSVGVMGMSMSIQLEIMTLSFRRQQDL